MDPWKWGQILATPVSIHVAYMPLCSGVDGPFVSPYPISMCSTDVVWVLRPCCECVRIWHALLQSLVLPSLFGKVPGQYSWDGWGRPRSLGTLWGLEPEARRVDWLWEWSSSTPHSHHCSTIQPRQMGEYYFVWLIVLNARAWCNVCVEYPSLPCCAGSKWRAAYTTQIKLALHRTSIKHNCHS